MQLYLRRTQRDAGLIGSKMLFCLDARAEFTAEETNDVNKYRLGGQVIYNSERSKKHLANVDASLDGSAKGLAKGLMYSALARMSLNITISSLANGHHIECKDLEELLGAEQAIRTACESTRTFLDVAAAFDGREQVVEFPGVNAPPSAPQTRRFAAPIEAVEAVQTSMGGMRQIETKTRGDDTAPQKEAWVFLAIGVVLIAVTILIVYVTAHH